MKGNSRQVHVQTNHPKRAYIVAVRSPHHVTLHLFFLFILLFFTSVVQALVLQNIRRGEN